MKTLLIVTNNKHKYSEIKAVLPESIHLITLADIGFTEDIPETATTLEGNAKIKAETVYNQFHYDCFADDTGLEVEALDGRPGVYSSRYAGEACNFDDNIHKLLGELSGKPNRKAHFRTVICLILEGKEYYFEGRINGQIITEKRGSNGFGYDPVFIPDGYSKTFAEMDAKEKNQISHRGLAMEEMIEFLKAAKYY